MEITLKLFNILNQYGRAIERKRVPEGVTVGEVIAMVKIPEEIPLLRIVNGVHVPIDHRLKEDDVLALFPPIAGG
jgi:molybdopterin converting factor small subunit